MNCTATRELVSAYIDGELPPEPATEIAEHLTLCVACSRDYDAMVATVRTLREGLVRFRAPDLLRARVRTALREEQEPAATTPTVRRGSRVAWRTVAAAMLIAVASSGVTLVATGRRAAPEPASEEVLASHIRSLMPDHLTDVRSSDQHNVKPWFNGRLDFSPAVPRLEDQGFPLLGGRVDYVRGRPVAVVVYGRRQHIINAFSWPTESGADAVGAPETRHGYNLMHWRTNGVEHWIASDLNAAELRQFVGLLQTAR
jgi:anti-sigma factor RsiW